MKTVKTLCLLIALVGYFVSFGYAAIPAADSTEFVTIVLVRHAEKASSDPDTELSEIGMERAKRLAHLLQDFNFSEIYSTPFKRTRGTIVGLAQKQKKEILSYKTNDLKAFADTLRTKWGKTILVAGHSNTTPNTVNALLKQERFPQLDDAEYGKIFIVIIHKGGATQVNVLNY